jgi:two-component system, LuxR family, response regulator FixJ
MTATIHVVDDEEAVRLSTQLLLATLGYDVRVYETADDLLAGPVPAGGCALVDMRMPGMDGLALTRAIRERGWPLPVILVSGHMEPTLGVRALRAGAFDVIEKPYSEDVLLEAIDRAVTHA